MKKLTQCLPAIQRVLSEKPLALYPDSWNEVPGGQLCMADFGGYDALLFLGTGCPFHAGETAELDGVPLSRIAASHEAAVILRRLLPFTAPQPVLGRGRTFGMGDRLGIATLGHIRAAKQYDVYPVLAQQSMRELQLTQKNYDDVLDRVTFQVLQAGYTKGYGADGDHLKSREEVSHAIACGYTMITLDCSEHIHGQGAPARDAACPLAKELEEIYLDRVFELPGASIRFTKAALRQSVMIYGGAIAFAKEIYDACIAGTQVELEISLDETGTPTTPAQHFFVASELRRAGVAFKTMAPRFCGEFQKGIDYIGDLKQFDEEFRVHVAIAGHFGYKISVHSGSDKFAVFPSVGRMSHGRFHLKTSGTSWLEALRLVALAEPPLFLELYQYAAGVFEEARACYHVSTELSDTPDAAAMAPEDLPALLDNPAARQLLHITYGKILNAEMEDGTPRFRGRLYRLWRERREEYAGMLEAHMRRHLDLLCP